MTIVHLFGWLSIVLLAWGALSIFVTPLIGQFLAGALQEPRERREGSSGPVQQNPNDSVLAAKLAAPRVQESARLTPTLTSASTKDMSTSGRAN